MKNIQHDAESYLFEGCTYSPERHLLLAVLDRAKRDLEDHKLPIQDKALLWFVNKQVLFPHGIGYGDILEHNILDAHRTRAIEELIINHPRYSLVSFS